jgi:rare lipoprotein A
MAVNTQKLLPSAKGSAVAKIRAASITKGISVKPKKIDTEKLLVLSKDRDDSPESIKENLLNIDALLKSILGEEKKNKTKKRKEKEKKEYEKEEKKLEAPKEAKKFNLPSLSLPGMSFLDRIKRFLLFTALGWLFTKFQDQLPKLEGIVKTITQVYGVAENIFKILLGGLVNFIDRGYQAYDKIREITKSIGGEKAEQDFDKLSGKLNEYINYVLIGGLALTGAINSFNKASGRASGKLAEGGTKKTTEEIAKRAAKKGIIQKTTQAARIGAKKAAQAVIGKQATRQLLRLVKGPLSRLPVLGGLIEFGLSWVLGDPVGKAAFRGVGTLLLGAVGSLILPGFGTFIGGVAGAELAGKLYEVLFENKKPQGKVQKKQGGGSITRGGNPQGGPTRSLKITRKRPPKVKPKQSQPGKDVGGKKNIQKLYPDPSIKTEIEGEQKNPWFDLLSTDKTQRDDKLKSLPNPYKALTGVAKKLKDIPFGIGALMGGAVDIALGEKLPKNAIDSLGSGIAYLISSVANQQVSASVSGIEKEISKMQSGGVVPRLRDFSKQDQVGSDVTRVLNSLIRQKVDEAIKEVQKQMMPGKYSEQRVSPPGETGPSTPPPRGPGGGGQGPSPTGENGRLSESVLKSVGPGGCRGGCRLWKPAAEAYLQMKAAAAKDKINFQLESAYRSYEHQKELYDAYKRGTGNLAAAPGTSDHGLGKAIDLYPTAAQDWVRAKGRQYGWYWPPETGEPWHFVYVGGGRLEPQKPQTQLPGQQPQIPDVQNYGVKDGEQKRVKYNNKNYVIARDKGKWRVYKVNPTTGLLEEVDRTDQSFVKVLDEYRKTQSPTSPKPQQPPGPSGNVKQSGVASWYGPGFDGKKTANGEIFDTNKLTAAHPTLPFGTMVTVTNKVNGKSVRVKINDRGPFAVDGRGNAIYPLKPHPTRVIDLSKAARDALGGQDLTQVDLSYKGGGIIPKQVPDKKLSSLRSYPSYSEGGMMIAIQPMIIEKPVPMPMGGNKTLTFPVPVGVNNNTNLSNLSQG